MNFLEIAKRVRQECGISGDGPTNVAGQIGIYAKIVNWVQVAHEEIQRRSDAWNFDWAEHSQPLTAGVESYHPATDWGLECKRIDGNGLYVFTTANGPNAKTWVPLVDWATFRTMRQVGLTGIPIYAAKAPDGKLHLHPAPQAGLTAAMEYFREPQVLVANTDVPRMPGRFHAAIVWRAVMLWAAHDESPGQFQTAERNYSRIMGEMLLSELPDLIPAGPLA